MKLSKAQESLLNQLSEVNEMYWSFSGNSPTQFNIKTAEAIEKKGLVKLEFLGNENRDIQYKLIKI